MSLQNQSRESQEKFFAVVNGARLIKEHLQLFMWLQGEIQALLPHDLLLVAHGNFSENRINYDVIGAAGDTHMDGLNHDDIEALIAGLFQRWQSNDHSAYALETMSGVALHGTCQCRLHRILRGMRSLMVLGIRDERTDTDTLYVPFRNTGRFDDSERRIFTLLLPHIDSATRRVTNYMDRRSPAGGGAETWARHRSGSTDRT